MQFYRLAITENQLPKHWSYGDAWEWYQGEAIDNRTSGFQVWAGIERVLAVAAGEASADGEYKASDYPFLLVVESNDFSDGAGEWLAIECADVISVKAVKTAEFIEWAKERWAEDLAAGYDAYEDDFEAWCEDSEAELLDWLNANAKTVAHEFVETLENPYKA